MLKFDPSTFGKLNATDYDALHDPGTTKEAVSLLAEVAAKGRVLEFAIGTGRLALPLVKRGLEVSGIEGAQEMVDILRQKPGGADVPVVVGDMADAQVAGQFDMVFLAYNTLFNLPSQQAQVRCFANAARHLGPGGRFLVETFVPDLSDFSAGQRVRTNRLDMKTVWLEAAMHDPLRQVIDFQRIRISDKGMQLVPLPMRYAWPAELDLMAQLAGLELSNRWGGWNKEPYTKDSTMHVSVYEKPA